MVGNGIAGHARKFFLEIRLRGGEELLESLGNFSIAADLQAATAESLDRIRCGETRERQRRAFDRRVGFRIVAGGERNAITCGLDANLEGRRGRP